MEDHEQKLPVETSIYRAWVVDHYGNTAFELPGGPWLGEAFAEDALASYFKKNPPKTSTSYDIGGYIEEIKLRAVINPKLDL